MPLFIAFDHSLELKGISMHLNAGCPRLQLDRLIFPQMTHTLYFSESEDFRSQCVWRPDIDLGVSDPSLTIRSTLRQVDRLPLGAFLTLLPGEDSLAFSAAFPPGKGNRKAKLHSVDVSMLGTVFNTEIDIDQGMLSFTADADLYGNYPAKLSISAPTNIPWDRMDFTVDGQINASTVQTIDQYVKDYVIEEIINKTLERERNARQAVIRANETLTTLTTQLRMRELRLSEARLNFERAFEASRIANKTLRNAEAEIDTTNTQIGAAQNALNQVCREDSCTDVEVRREVCQTCYEDILVEGSGLCTELRPKVPSPFFEEYHILTIKTWTYVTLCEDYYRCCYIYSTTKCERVCRGKCISQEYEVPIKRRVQRTVLEPVTVPCDPPMLVLGQSVPMTCCVSYTERSPNLQCQEMCRSAQVQATERLREVNSEAAEPFERLNEARRAVLAANTRLARARIQRDSAQFMRDEANKPYLTAQQATVVSLLNQQRLLNEIKDELKIVRQYETVGIEGVIKLNDVRFSTEISTQSPTIIPLMFTYSTLGRDLTKEIPFDFTASYELNQRQIAVEIAADIVSSTSSVSRRSTMRYRRQDDSGSEIVERSRNKESFQENCALIANIEEYIENIFSTLEMIDESINTATDKLQQSKENLEMQADSNMTEMDTMINFDNLEELFNITRDDFRDDSDEEIIDNYKNYFRDLANTTEDILDSVDNTSFGEWQASMEMLHNESDSAAGYPCTGFADCLDRVSGLLKRLITDLQPGADKESLQQKLDQNRQRFIQLATSMTLRVPQAVTVVTDMLETVNSETLTSYWCSLPPNITCRPTTIAS